MNLLVKDKAENVLHVESIPENLDFPRLEEFLKNESGFHLNKEKDTMIDDPQSLVETFSQINSEQNSLSDENYISCLLNEGEIDKNKLEEYNTSSSYFNNNLKLYLVINYLGKFILNILTFTNKYVKI